MTPPAPVIRFRDWKRYERDWDRAIIENDARNDWAREEARRKARDEWKAKKGGSLIISFGDVQVHPPKKTS